MPLGCSACTCSGDEGAPSRTRSIRPTPTVLCRALHTRAVYADAAINDYMPVPSVRPSVRPSGRRLVGASVWSFDYCRGALSLADRILSYITLRQAAFMWLIRI